MFTIRTAQMSDLDAVTEIEAACFPAAEAASRQSMASRLAAFPAHFYIAEQNGTPIGFVNGSVGNSTVIEDEMYENAALHNPHGAWQMVFGLDVLPAHRHTGVAHALMQRLIEDARVQGRAGVVLTCKEHLIGFYEQFGFCCKGTSASVHGGAIWYDMRLTFAAE